jgi:hypothetical protein
VTWTRPALRLKPLNTHRLQVYHETIPFGKLRTSLGNLTHLLCQPHALTPDDEPYIRLAGAAWGGPLDAPEVDAPDAAFERLRRQGVDEIIKSGSSKG